MYGKSLGGNRGVGGLLITYCFGGGGVEKFIELPGVPRPFARLGRGPSREGGAGKVFLEHGL